MFETFIAIAVLSLICFVGFKYGKSIGSRQGITSHDYSPVVAVRAAGDPDGAAWGVALAWSGSWRLLVDVPPFRPGSGYVHGGAERKARRPGERGAGRRRARSSLRERRP